MSDTDWTALRILLKRAELDVATNAALPAAPPLTAAQMAAGLRAAQPYLASAIALMAAHRGILTAAVDTLMALDGPRAPYAAKIAAVIDALPGLAINAVGWMPTIAGFLEMTAAAPNPPPGMGWKAGDGSNLDAPPPPEVVTHA